MDSAWRSQLTHLFGSILYGSFICLCLTCMHPIFLTNQVRADNAWHSQLKDIFGVLDRSGAGRVGVEEMRLAALAGTFLGC